MDLKNTKLPDPELILQELLDSGAIDPGIITDGLTDSPESQAEFDELQKGKPPAVNGSAG